jgi:hypothetical protein
MIDGLLYQGKGKGVSAGCNPVPLFPSFGLALHM